MSEHPKSKNNAIDENAIDNKKVEKALDYLYSILEQLTIAERMEVFKLLARGKDSIN